jgi:hypothetical protein
MADAFGVHETMICRCLLAANVLRHTKSDKSRRTDRQLAPRKLPRFAALPSTEKRCQFRP